MQITKYLIYEVNSKQYAKRIDTDGYYALGSYNCMISQLLNYSFDSLSHAKYEFGFIARRGQKKGHVFQIHELTINTDEKVIDV